MSALEKNETWEKEVRIACVNQSTHNGKKEYQTPQ